MKRYIKIVLVVLYLIPSLIYSLDNLPQHNTQIGVQNQKIEPIVIKIPKKLIYEVIQGTNSEYRAGQKLKLFIREQKLLSNGSIACYATVDSPQSNSKPYLLICRPYEIEKKRWSELISLGPLKNLLYYAVSHDEKSIIAGGAHIKNKNNTVIHIDIDTKAITDFGINFIYDYNACCCEKFFKSPFSNWFHVVSINENVKIPKGNLIIFDANSPKENCMKDVSFLPGQLSSFAEVFPNKLFINYNEQNFQIFHIGLPGSINFKTINLNLPIYYLNPNNKLTQVEIINYSEDGTQLLMRATYGESYKNLKELIYHCKISDNKGNCSLLFNAYDFKQETKEFITPNILSSSLNNFKKSNPLKFIFHHNKLYFFDENAERVQEILKEFKFNDTLSMPKFIKTLPKGFPFCIDGNNKNGIQNIYFHDEKGFSQKNISQFLNELGKAKKLDFSLFKPYQINYVNDRAIIQLRHIKDWFDIYYIIY